MCICLTCGRGHIAVFVAAVGHLEASWQTEVPCGCQIKLESLESNFVEVTCELESSFVLPDVDEIVLGPTIWEV